MSEVGIRGWRGYSWAGSSNRHGVPVVEQVLQARMACFSEERHVWVDPKIRASFPDLSTVKDMGKAAGFLAEAIKRISRTGSGRIGIFSDYDADGATAAAVMGLWLAELDIPYDIRIPDRFRDGYGPNMIGLRELKDLGCDPVLVLDSGSTAFDVLEEAAGEGIECIVVDHHACEERHPVSRAFVNPNRKDDGSGLGYMCAAGLSLLVTIAAQKELEKDPAWKSRRPDMNLIAAVAAIGTVADVVPLRGFNRALVSTGLKIASTARAERPLLGLSALMWVCGVTESLSSTDVGFRLGPRINVAGRLSDSTLGAKLLTCTDAATAADIAGKLNELNAERQAIEKKTREEAMAQVPQTEGHGCIVVAGDWHEGVVGITAGRIKEACLRPAIVLSRTEEGLLKGSGRSMPGFDLGHAIIEARKAGILLKGGGHGMAAGLTLDPARLPDLVAYLDQQVEESDFARLGAVLSYDAVLDPADANVATVDALTGLEPYGEGNPTPRFLIRDIHVESADTLKEIHCRYQFRLRSGERIKAMLFSAVGTSLAAGLTSAVGSRVDLIASLEINEWQGRRSVELKIEDARLHDAMEMRQVA